jgi:hypothetical protein
MNETTENFWQVWSNLETWQPPAVFWRLYHNEQGHPLFYTQQDCPGNYIDVTPEQYQRANMQVRVVDRQLIEINKPVFKKLMPSTTGTPCEPADVAIVVDPNQPHQCWRTKTNETN